MEYNVQHWADTRSIERISCYNLLCVSPAEWLACRCVCYARYPVTWLDSFTTTKPLYHNPAIVPRVYWDASLSLDHVPVVDYTQLVEEHQLAREQRTESGDRAHQPALRQVLTNLLRYGFAFVDNTPPNLDSTMSATNVVSFPQAIISIQFLARVGRPRSCCRHLSDCRSSVCLSVPPSVCQTRGL